MQKRIAKFLVIFTLALLLIPTAAQDSEGRGVIREGTTFNIEALNQFNPLLCDNFTCARIVNWLLPTLFYINPETVRFERAATGTNALVANWSVSVDGRSYTFTIRDNLTWSDGTPITAYDALFSLMVAHDRRVPIQYYVDRDETEAAVVGFTAPNANTLVVQLHEPTCQVFDHLDIPIIPYHPFDTGFAEFVAANSAGDTIPDQVGSWHTASENYDFRIVNNHPFSLNPLTTNESAFVLDDVQPPDYLRLRSSDGELAYEFVPVLNSTDNINRFLSGDLNYMHNFPYSRIADLESTGGTASGGTSTLLYTLAFNLADPTAPRSWDTEEDDGQGVHPVWGDRRVRQAAALALNVPEIIEISAFGNGTPLGSLAIPGSWYDNPRLTPIQQDQTEARRLLEAAGWRDADGDGVRECRNCETAAEGTRLNIELTHDSTEDLITNLIAAQLETVGFDVTVTTNPNPDQNTDMTLVALPLDYPYDPVSVFERFETTEDIVPHSGNETGANFTSYSNRNVDNLLRDARTMQNCADYRLRAAYYQDAARFIVDDIAYIPLFAPHRIYAVGAGVNGFAPLPSRPQWNILSWQVIGGTS